MEKLIVNSDYNGLRLDKFLADNDAYKSRSLAAKFCDNKKVQVNGQVAQKKLTVYENDEVMYQPAFEDSELIGQDIPLNIKYEDDDLLVISKQPGLVCHPFSGHNKDTLVNALIHHCKKEHLFVNNDDDTRLGIVHRLDADTSGLMIVAKSQNAGVKLTQDFKNHLPSRHYLALVYGAFKHKTGKIDVPIIRNLNKRPKMVASKDPKAKRAVTSFEVLEQFFYENTHFSMLDCKIHTGRTHQIRSHMEYINHPVVGDPLYNSGGPKDFDAKEVLGLNRQFLHSYKISFEHPITKKQMSFKDELAKDLLSALEKIRCKN